MPTEKEQEVRKRISEEIQKQGRKKTIFAEFLGYNGNTQIKIKSFNKILIGEKIVTISLLNKIAEFLLVPVGYFFSGNRLSPFSQIDSELVTQKIAQCFSEESTQKKIGKKKYMLGSLLGKGKDNTARIQSVNRILQQKKDLKLKELFIIADFFEKPIEWFFEP